MKILLVGVGGVGCEFLFILKEYLKLNPQEKIEIMIIDDDLVEESNLSRQRLYKLEDVGRPKVFAAYNTLSKTMKLSTLKMKAEAAVNSNFLKTFNVIVLAVDNLETRRWMNSAIMQSCNNNKWMLLDLGVQGFKFSIRKVKKGMACLECSMPLYLQDDQDSAVPVCSIYGNPRNLNDCIHWAINQIKEQDIKKIYEAAKRRAESFGIDYSELSFNAIKKLMKRSIPAVASVNSLLAARAVEILTSPDEDDQINNFWMVNLENGYYELSTCLEPVSDCIICEYFGQKL